MLGWSCSNAIYVLHLRAKLCYLFNPFNNRSREIIGLASFFTVYYHHEQLELGRPRFSPFLSLPLMYKNRLEIIRLLTYLFFFVKIQNFMNHIWLQFLKITAVLLSISFYALYLPVNNALWVPSFFVNLTVVQLNVWMEKKTFHTH